MINGLTPSINGPSNCICITHKENQEDVDDCEMFKAGHPVPDDTGALASNRVISALLEAGEDLQQAGYLT